MKKLPNEWTRIGLLSRVIQRTGNIVMVQLGKAECYEVAIVQSHKGYKLPGGNGWAEAAEYMPSNEQFGRLGWYFMAKDKADAKFAELVEASGKPKRGPKSAEDGSGYPNGVEMALNQPVCTKEGL